ncbi:MAG: hypothetical protein JWL65_6222 [Gammaproteobacteria bacterium]|nr:hypothetical protein [Gammaproteobacteria bacterium]
MRIVLTIVFSLLGVVASRPECIPRMSGGIPAEAVSGN